MNTTNNPGPALAARALRDCLRALHAIGDGARQHIAIAMRELINAIRAEPSAVQPESEPARPYWIEPDS